MRLLFKTERARSMAITFKDFDLQQDILMGIEKLGFESPSPIQAEAIPVLLQEPTDMIALAQTGTGKTAAFGLPILQKIDFDSAEIQALILSPTRELCIQTQEELEKYGKYVSGLQSLAVYGGAPIGTQIRGLKASPQIIVATPGRLIDLLNRGVLDLGSVEIVVLDEADEMLNMGFRDDIDTILSNSPDRNTWLFSATMNNDVRRISKRFMKSPKEISVARENAGNEHIDHQYYVINAHQRFESLCRLLDFNPDIYGIIFTRTKQDAQEVSERLIRRGFQVSALHGDMDQKARTRVMDKFKQRQFQVIVATDVAARGIDVNDITHVINYELPEDPEVYTHRSGRTARAGKSGICLSLVSSREIGRIRQVERLSKTKFHKGELPDGAAVIRKRLYHILDSLETAEPSASFLENTGKIIIEKTGNTDPVQLVQKILWMQLQGLVKDYEKAADLNAGYQQVASSGREGGKGRTRRMFMNLGTKDGLQPGKLAGYVAEITDMEPEMFSKITVRELSSFFNVPSDSFEFIQNAFSKVKFNGRRVRVEEADDKPTFKKDFNKFGGDKESGFQKSKRGKDAHEPKRFSRNKNPYSKF